MDCSVIDDVRGPRMGEGRKAADRAEIQDPEGTMYEPKSFLGVAICKGRLAALIAPINCDLQSTRASSIPGRVYTCPAPATPSSSPSSAKYAGIVGAEAEADLCPQYLQLKDRALRAFLSTSNEALCVVSTRVRPHRVEYGRSPIFISICLWTPSSGIFYPRWGRQLLLAMALDICTKFIRRARDGPMRDTLEWTLYQAGWQTSDILCRGAQDPEGGKSTGSGNSPARRKLSVYLYWYSCATFGTLTAAKVCVVCVFSGEGCPPPLSPIHVTPRWEPFIENPSLNRGLRGPWPNPVQPQIHRFILPLPHVPVCRDRFRVPASPYNVFLRRLGNLFYRPELCFACTVQAGTPRSALVCGLWTIHANSFISGSSFLHEACSGSGRDLLTVRNPGEEFYNAEDLARCRDPPG
ncbi:hypothetical protein B0H14DRAFT_3434241 [Mycena olivaceomarginata]|nr:hypothetical protein B0H14DRAFT_3434241 [Mycena olivaceomarginata]